MDCGGKVNNDVDFTVSNRGDDTIGVSQVGQQIIRMFDCAPRKGERTNAARPQGRDDEST